jgi:alpha-D-ribose 1-methylphosphonate 5-triphosphate diphosphatase PhnM
MSKRTRLTCNDCYFRQLELCALQTDAPCPTFRLHDRGEIEAPRQAQLVPRAFEPPSPVVRFLPQHQAA